VERGVGRPRHDFSEALKEIDARIIRGENRGQAIAAVAARLGGWPESTKRQLRQKYANRPRK
jgi:hypothetical protein